MEENKMKMKVAMICHFSNTEVRKHLPLSNGKLYRFMRKIFRLPKKNQGYADLAPWDSSLIRDFNNREDIELLVISAHSGLKKRKIAFSIENVKYLFVRCHIATMLKYVLKNPKLWVKLNPMTPVIVGAVNEFNPDIVLLVGAENAYYSSSVLHIKKYPVYLLCQTVYNDPAFNSEGTINAYVEMEIFKKLSYVGVYCEKHYKLLQDLQYKGNILHFQFPIEKTINFGFSPLKDKPIDYINFALQMSSSKGFDDCLKALAIVKKRYPDVQLHLVDGGPDTYRDYLKSLIFELDLERNVSFIPFFADRADLFAHLQKVKFAVLPCKLDNLSGTQLQSMRYGLPVVCYRTAGTPSLNKKKKSVLIAEMNNYKDLAEKMLLLMEDKELAEELRRNAKDYIIESDAKSDDNMNALIDNFKAIINNYYNGVPIPQNQLFSLKV